MDLNEILAFKPDKPSLKRQADGEAASGGVDLDFKPPPAKVSRGATAGQNSHTFDMNSVSDEEKLRILQSLEEDDEGEGEGEGLDAGAVKRMLLSFEKKVMHMYCMCTGVAVNTLCSVGITCTCTVHCT